MLEEHKEQAVDWENVPVDTPILVRDSLNEKWKKRHFAGLNSENEPCGWIDGTTKFTQKTGKTNWNYAKLWEGSPEQAAEQEAQCTE